MIASLLTRALGWALLLGVPALFLVVLPRLTARIPAPPPERPQGAPDDGAWLLFPFQVIAALAGLSWLAVGLLVFLAPLLAVAWWVLR